MKIQSIISISLALLLSLPAMLLAEPITEHVDLSGGVTDSNNYELKNPEDGYPAVYSYGNSQNTMTGALTLVSGETVSFFVDDGNAPLEIKGEIKGSGNLTNTFESMDSQAALILSHTNSYTGTTYFAGEQVQLNAKDAIKSSSEVKTDTSIYMYADQTINNLSGNGSVFVPDSVTNQLTLTLNYDVDTTYNGQYNGNGNLEKTGNSMLTMTQEVKHTGKTIVSQGTLKYTGEISAISPIEVKKGATAEFAQSSDVKFNAGISGEGTFKKSGTGELRMDTTATPVTVANVAVDAGTLLLNGNLPNSKLYVTTKTAVETGQLEIGFSDTSTFLTQSSTVKNLELNSKGQITFDFGTDVGNKPGEYFDTLFATDSAVLNGGTFNFTWAGSVTGGNEAAWKTLANNGEMFLLIGCDSVAGDLTTIALTGLDNTFWKIDLANNNGVNGVFLMNVGVTPEPPVPPTPPTQGSGVPEPSTWALLILGSIGLMYFKRRK